MKKPLYRSMNWMFGFLVVVLAVTVIWVGCNEKYQSPSGPEELQENLLDEGNPQIKAVMELQDRHTPSLMEIAGVVGTATGIGADGKPTIL